ncbi:MAG TPA: hypothetical protein VN066_09415 [Rhodocyclaceae bacterium]|nr:hypothetical protein [Rhodocyclaceae bacterium]
MKKLIDVFNGDADGLCALMQWRRVYPAEAQLLSGVKRDNALLRRVPSGVDVELLVLDINFENNRADAARLLADGAHIRYFDHHYPGERIEHPALALTVDESPEMCTSLLVHRALDGREVTWAIAGAFGDNLPAVATRLALQHGFDDGQTSVLRQLGELLNYNGYGSDLADLHFDPEVLYRALRDYGEPFAFVADADAYAHLQAGYADDMAAALAVKPAQQGEATAIYHLPDLPWSRRVIGVWANLLSQQARERAHLIFCPDGSGKYTASVRAPQLRPSGAAEFCRQFPGGGGRAAAGGITGLSEASIDAVSASFQQWFAVN